MIPFARSANRMSLLLFLANVSGALVIWFYLAVIDPPFDHTRFLAMPDTDAVMILLVFGLIPPLLAVIGIQIGLRPIARWAKKISSGTIPAADLPPQVARAILNWVLSSAVVTLLGWPLVGLFMLAINVIDRRELIGMLAGGVIAGGLIFFGGELIWRQQFPHFFPDGGLSNRPGFRLYVSGRLFVIFFTIIIIPLLLFVVSVQRSQSLLYMENRQIVLANLVILQLFILLVGTIFSIGLVLLLARSIIEPLRALEYGMSRVAQNDYEVRVPVLSNDELGYLSERFNHMTEALLQAERTRQLFDLYASPEVVAAALANGANLGGELSYCTILFSDVRDFTVLSERLDPARLISLINHYMSAIVPQIAASGGVITRFGGDSILAVFGSPLNPIDDHAFRAVRAARSIHQALGRFNKLQKLADEPELSIGVGIATGPVIAGNVGGHERLEYTVMGEAANLASRLQDLTKEYKCPVLISAETYRDLPPLVRKLFEKRTDVVIRGKQEPVTIYALPQKRVQQLIETAEVSAV